MEKEGGVLSMRSNEALIALAAHERGRGKVPAQPPARVLEVLAAVAQAGEQVALLRPLLAAEALRGQMCTFPAALHLHVGL